ncbi:MAG: hypothetical protein EXR79_00755 [Myxococcales bacterium]|nr:hypothetical protein [Myxococcales bacterium]
MNDGSDPADVGTASSDDSDVPSDAVDAAGSDAATTPDSEPAIACAGKIELKCPVGKHCDVVGCGADIGGMCVSLPALCSAGGADVCGCNSVTYPNDCARIEAGAAKASEGKCKPKPKECTLGDAKACAAGEYCAAPAVGVCGGSGTCATKPQLCPAISQPVCGCDDKTYGNACAAALAGSNLSTSNACPVSGLCGGFAGIKCPAGQACDIASCGADVPGKCVVAPPVPCPGADGKSQVCGCNAKTYASDCQRLAAGVAKKAAGPCPPVPTNCVVGGPAVCSAGQYCKANLAYQCGGAGKCAVQGQVCPLVFKPVCGCDSKSYGNACQAAVAGQNVKAEGACPTGGGGPCTVGGAVACQANEYCKASLANACGGAGTCALKPTICQPPNATVCGCDGKHYASGCSAAVAGVNVAKTGTCPLAGQPCSIGGVPCYQGYWCKGAAANTCSGVGTCAVTPSSCAATLAPVCGCNDKSYLNVCEATKALMNTKAATPCTGGGSGAVCATAKQCQPGEGCLNAKCTLCPGWTCPAAQSCALAQKKDPCTCKCYLP